MFLCHTACDNVLHNKIKTSKRIISRHFPHLPFFSFIVYHVPVGFHGNSWVNLSVFLFSFPLIDCTKEMEVALQFEQWCPARTLQIAKTSIHFLPLYPPHEGRRGCCANLSWHRANRWGTPWTGCQSITGPHRDKQPSLSHYSQFRVSNLPNPHIACFWTVGGNRRTRRKPTHTQGEHANWPCKPESSCCKGKSANHYTNCVHHKSQDFITGGYFTSTLYTGYRFCFR